jgi:uncharacterized lipoprotein YddW (UPF0748 family)
VDPVTIETPEQIFKHEMHRNALLDLIRQMNISTISVKVIVEGLMNYQDQTAAYGSEVRLFQVR